MCSSPLDEAPVCRICFEGSEESSEALISNPCACRGSSKYVHGSCCLKAFKARGIWQDVSCHTCKHPFSGNLGLSIARYGMSAVAAISGPDSVSVAYASIRLADAYARMGNVDQELAILEMARVVFEREFGLIHVAVAQVLERLGNAYGESGDATKQKELFERVLAIHEASDTVDACSLARTFANLGNAYVRLNQLEKAKPLLEKALSLKEQELGAEHLDIASTLVNFAVALGQMGELGRTRALLERAVAILEREYGRDHRQLVAPLANLARVHGELGDAAEEVRLLERVVAIEGRDSMVPDVQFVKTLLKLAHSHGLAGNRERQTELLEQTLSIKGRRECLEHNQMIRAFSVLQGLHFESGSLWQASQVCERIVTLQQGKYGPESAETIDALKGLKNMHNLLKTAQMAATQEILDSFKERDLPRFQVARDSVKRLGVAEEDILQILNKIDSEPPDRRQKIDPAPPDRRRLAILLARKILALTYERVSSRIGCSFIFTNDLCASLPGGLEVADAEQAIRLGLQAVDIAFAARDFDGVRKSFACLRELGLSEDQLHQILDRLHVCLKHRTVPQSHE